jgi:hypothetical protein
MDGSKYLTFRSNKKPAFSFKIPINADTLFGQYRGAIRFSPTTGKLVLCYGPMFQPDGRSERPVLSMLVKEKLADDLWNWYVNHGRVAQKKRASETALVMRDPDTGVIKRVTDVVKRERPTPSSFPDDDLPDTTKLAAFYYADLYGLPGASYLLSYAEVQYLEQVMASVASEQSKITPTLAYNTPQPGGPLGMDKRFLERAPVTLAELADAPHDCPPFIKAAMGAKWTTLDDWNEEDDTTFDSMFPHFAKHNCIVKGEYGLFYKNLVAGLPEGPARERFTFNPRISSGRRNRRLEYDEMDPYDEEFYRDYPEYYDEYPRRKRLKSPPPKNSPMINAKIPPMMMSSGTGPSQKMEVFSDNLYGFGNTRDQRYETNNTRTAAAEDRVAKHGLNLATRRSKRYRSERSLKSDSDSD